MNDAAMMIAALRQDASPRSGWVRMGGAICEPREVFIVGAGWAREDGSRISGWRGSDYFAHRPHLLDRWLLRRAVRRWIRNRDALARREFDC